MSDIKCSVKSCKHYDNARCSASHINVCCCGCAEPADCAETSCGTFERK